MRSWLLLRGLVVVGAFVAVAGCGRQATQQAPPSDKTGPPVADPDGPVTLYYDCEGRTFTVRVHADTASVMVPDKTFVLVQVPAASGAKYSDGTTTFWSKGEEATLTLAGRTYEGCRHVGAP